MPGSSRDCRARRRPRDPPEKLHISDFIHIYIYILYMRMYSMCICMGMYVFMYIYIYIYAHAQGYSFAYLLTSFLACLCIELPSYIPLWFRCCIITFRIYMKRYMQPSKHTYLLACMHSWGCPVGGRELGWKNKTTSNSTPEGVSTGSLGSRVASLSILRGVTEELRRPDPTLRQGTDLCYNHMV